MRYLEKLGVRQVLAHALPDGRTSPNQIPVVEVVLALFAAVLTGGRRFAHVERTDEVVQAILGVQRMPSAMTLVSAHQRTKIVAGAADRMTQGRSRPRVSKDRRVR